MGTRFDIVIPHVDPELCENIYKDIQQEVLRLDEKLSFFNTESDLSVINREAGKKPLAIDPEMFQILKKTLKYHRLTGGAFDVCKAALKHNLQIPAKEGVEAILLDEVHSTIFFGSTAIKIDLGGLGKGLALENVKNMLLNEGIENALISFGESSVLAVGKHPKGHCWKIGIRSIIRPGEFMHQFELINSSLSTSGNFYFNDDGSVSQNNHIIDPETDKLISKNQLVLVVSESPLNAEIISTALYVKDKNEAQSVIQNFSGIHCAFFDLINNKESIEIDEQ